MATAARAVEGQLMVLGVVQRSVVVGDVVVSRWFDRLARTTLSSGTTSAL